MNYAAESLQVVNVTTDMNKPTTMVISVDILDTLETAGRVVKDIPFVVTTALKHGQAIFFAQLKGGKRFSVVPVMPKTAAGETLAPPNGEQGYLTLELSENAQLTETEGRYEFTERPTFKAWESVAARTARLAKEAKGSK